MSGVRPRLHLTPERGWLNDPHGITARDGGYHLFHQAVPDATHHKPEVSWGHATSTDLLTFEHRPPALEPDADDVGAWTGCLVEDTIFYTQVVQPSLSDGRVRVARPTDPSWDTWEKGDVVVGAPADLDLVEFRDPFVIREDTGWRMFVAGAERGGRAVVPTWTSDDLARWEYDGLALARSGDDRDPWMGEMWECPQFFRVGDAWAMVGSVWSPGSLHFACYALGDLTDGRFTAERWGRLSWGSYYAPSYFTDLDGEPTLMFWMRDVGDVEAGWMGCLSVPHRVGLRDDRLVLDPHPNLPTDLLEDGPSGLTLVDGPVTESWVDGGVRGGPLGWDG